MKEENKNLLFKNIDLVVAYLIIFGVGLAIVYFMTTYLNKKVQEFTTASTTTESVES